MLLYHCQFSNEFGHYSGLILSRIFSWEDLKESNYFFHFQNHGTESEKHTFNFLRLRALYLCLHPCIYICLCVCINCSDYNLRATSGRLTEKNWSHKWHFQISSKLFICLGVWPREGLKIVRAAFFTGANLKHPKSIGDSSFAFFWFGMSPMDPTGWCDEKLKWLHMHKKNHSVRHV